MKSPPRITAGSSPWEDHCSKGRTSRFAPRSWARPAFTQPWPLWPRRARSSIPPSRKTCSTRCSTICSPTRPRAMGVFASSASPEARSSSTTRTTRTARRCWRGSKRPPPSPSGRSGGSCSCSEKCWSWARSRKPSTTRSARRSRRTAPLRSSPFAARRGATPSSLRRPGSPRPSSMTQPPRASFCSAGSPPPISST